MVPFLDLKAGYLELQNELDDAVRKSLESGWYIGGDLVEKFEKEFATYTGAQYCITTGNGLDALHLSLIALGVGPDDEVIVPSHTFIATWLAVSHVGATIVPVEPNERNYTIDIERLEKAITTKTKVIIPVHLYGHPADLDPILEIANRYGIKVLEDAAQAHGAKYKSKRIGSHGDAVAWSFYPGKNLGAFGDGGAITTNSITLAEKIRLLKNYGSSKKYHHESIGFNSRLDPIQAAVLSVKLHYLEKWNRKRKAIALSYISRLANSKYKTPYLLDGEDSSWHLFVIRTTQRDNLKLKLRERGVETLIHYPLPPHKQQAYSGKGQQFNSFPIAEKISQEILSLPIGPHLTDSHVEQVIMALNMK